MKTIKEDSDWESTTVQNLIRYRPSGTYFARFKVGGKLIRQGLETTVFSVAKLRLPDKIGEFRAKHESAKAFKSGKMTFGDAMEVYLNKIEASVRLKPRSKYYRRLMVDFIKRSWPGLPDLDARKISDRDCEEWLTRFQRSYAPSVVNNAIGTLRAIFEETVAVGARFSNPVVGLKRMRVRPKKLLLPSRAEFLKFVEAIRKAGARQSKDCADLVQFLAYSGLRVSEAKYVTWADVNFKKDELHVQGEPDLGTKNGESRRVPMIAPLRSLLEAMRQKRADEPVSEFVMRVNECQIAMTNAAKTVGIKRITHHDLRHLFATICIESGVDVPTVSRWLGHKDGGALCMKTYGHLREDHSSAQAKRVNFEAV